MPSLLSLSRADLNREEVAAEPAATAAGVRAAVGPSPAGRFDVGNGVGFRLNDAMMSGAMDAVVCPLAIAAAAAAVIAVAVVDAPSFRIAWVRSARSSRGIAHVRSGRGGSQAVLRVLWRQRSSVHLHLRRECPPRAPFSLHGETSPNAEMYIPLDFSSPNFTSISNCIRWSNPNLLEIIII